MLFSFYLKVDDVINFKIFIESTSKVMAEREKKEMKMNIQTFEYLENEERFLDEIKIILKGHHLVKNKILIKNSRHKL